MPMIIILALATPVDVPGVSLSCGWLLHRLLVDATGGVWTLGLGGETLRNGVHIGWGYARSLL